MDLAIKFGDNDYHSLFSALIETLSGAFATWSTTPTEDQVRLLIKGLIVPYHFLFQSKGEKDADLSYVAHLAENCKIFIAEELYDYLSKVGWDNGETVVIVSGQISLL
jgi:hypothetical protein